MRLKTFSRYSFPDYDISCGTIAVSLVTGKCPSETKRRLTRLRTKRGWSWHKILVNSDYMYWYEAVTLVGKLAKNTKTRYPRYSPPLKNIIKKFKRGETYLVCTTDHLQVVKDGLIYDTWFNGSLNPHLANHHPWAKRKTWCYRRLTDGK